MGDQIVRDAKLSEDEWEWIAWRTANDVFGLGLETVVMPSRRPARQLTRTKRRNGCPRHESNARFHLFSRLKPPRGGEDQHLFSGFEVGAEQRVDGE